MHKVISKWPHQDSVHVEWNLGKRCNFDCSYCPTEIHDNTSPHTNIKVLLDAVDALSEIDKSMRVSFTGGEPCVHPKFTELVDHASQRVDWINVTTNGTRTAQYYSDLNVNHIVFSLHVEDDEHWRRCAETVLMFSQINEGAYTKKPFQVNLMAHHKLMDRVKECATMFDGHSIPYVVRRIRWTEGDHDVFDDLKYEGKDLEWILNQTSTAKPNVIIDDKEEMHANDVIKKHLNQFEGWKCSAGIESLMINWDGEVHRATCRVGGSIGNIYDGSFEQPEDWITCTRKWCTCAADIPLTKELSIS
jgi:MoaA/NifB/PqqE/SkfB family radical SAM enzyme